MITQDKLQAVLSLLCDDPNKQSTSCDSPWQVGKVYFIRTVTHHLTGRIKSVGSVELVVTEAAWIADDGRFHDALKEEKFSEVEPFPVGKDVIIGRQSVIDAVEISAPQLSQK